MEDYRPQPVVVDDADDVDERTPLFTRVNAGEEWSVSASRTFLNLVKGMIGPGCLALPMAFYYGGLWTGLGLLFVVGFINIHGMALLVKASQFLCERSGKMELDYGHLAKKAFDYGPVAIQPYSKKALYTVNAIICIYQIGICSVQFVFIGANFREVMKFFDDRIVLSTQAYISIFLVPVILLNFIRHLKFLAICSGIGNLSILVGFVIIFQEIVRPPYQYDQGDVDPVVTSLPRFLMYMGSVMYAFEGQSMILPMENKMKRPHNMIRPCGVLHASMMMVLCTYSACGFFGYMKYGSGVLGSITLNMPQETLYQVVNLILVLAAFVGLPLQIYIIVEMLWPAIRRKLPEHISPYADILEYIFRTLLILLQYTFAMVVPQLEFIIPLLGVTVGILISLVLPPLIDIVTFWDHWTSLYSSNLWRTVFVIKDLFMICLGVFGIVGGLYANIEAIVSSR